MVEDTIETKDNKKTINETVDWLVEFYRQKATYNNEEDKKQLNKEKRAKRGE